MLFRYDRNWYEHDSDTRHLTRHTDSLGFYLGLTTINASTLTAFQQVILFLLMTIVRDRDAPRWFLSDEYHRAIQQSALGLWCWLESMLFHHNVYIHRHHFDHDRRFFRVKCQHIITKTTRSNRPQYRTRTALLNAISGPVSVSPLNEAVPSSSLTLEQIEKLRLSQRVSRDVDVDAASDDTSQSLPKQESQDGPISSSNTHYAKDLHVSPVAETSSLRHSPFRSGPTIEFRVPTTTSARRRLTTISGKYNPSALIYNRIDCDAIYAESVPYNGRPVIIPRSPSEYHNHVLPSKFSNFGGFPGPIDLFRHAFPKTYKALTRKLTLPHTTTLMSSHFTGTREDARRAPWLPFDGLIVRRNSFFHTDRLTDEQLEAVGGVEYRALRFLSYFVIFVGSFCLPWNPYSGT